MRRYGSRVIDAKLCSHVITKITKSRTNAASTHSKAQIAEIEYLRDNQEQNRKVEQHMHDLERASTTAKREVKTTTSSNSNINRASSLREERRGLHIPPNAAPWITNHESKTLSAIFNYIAHPKLQCFMRLNKVCYDSRWVHTFHIVPIFILTWLWVLFSQIVSTKRHIKKTKKRHQPSPSDANCEIVEL